MAVQEADEIVSRFFEQSEDTILLSPYKIGPNNKDDTLDSSLDSSQLSQASTEDPDSLSLSQLTIETQEPLLIQPYFNITPREMPTSPHYVFEEEFGTNPWALLIATVFLTKTAGKVARPFMKEFFDQYPTPYHVLDGRPTSLERFFEKIGLKKRAHMIWKLSFQFLSARWRRASDLHGIGKYGEDAYRVFCLGHTDLDPGDRYIKLYVDWLRGHTEFLEENGVIDCECVVEDPVLEYYRVTLRE